MAKLRIIRDVTARLTRVLGRPAPAGGFVALEPVTVNVDLKAGALLYAEVTCQERGWWARLWGQPATCTATLTTGHAVDAGVPDVVSGLPQDAFVVEE